MIIGVLESGDVQIFEDVDAALREWRPHARDLESGVITLYDDDGVWLEPVVTRRPHRWLPFASSVGDVELRRNPDSDWPDPIGVALDDAVELLPSQHVGSLAELRARFPSPHGGDA